MNHQHQFASPLGRDLFAMFSVPPMPTEFHKVTEEDLDGRIGDFSTKPVHLPIADKKTIQDEISRFRAIGEHRGTAKEL